MRTSTACLRPKCLAYCHYTVLTLKLYLIIYNNDKARFPLRLHYLSLVQSKEVTLLLRILCRFFKHGYFSFFSSIVCLLTPNDFNHQPSNFSIDFKLAMYSYIRNILICTVYRVQYTRGTQPLFAKCHFL